MDNTRGIPAGLANAGQIMVRETINPKGGHIFETGLLVKQDGNGGDMFVKNLTTGNVDRWQANKNVAPVETVLRNQAQAIHKQERALDLAAGVICELVKKESKPQQSGKINFIG